MPERPAALCDPARTEAPQAGVVSAAGSRYIPRVPASTLILPAPGTIPADEAAFPAERPRFSVVVPVYNERENLPGLIAELRQVFAVLGEPYEIILVDDRSTDGSDRLIAETARAVPEVRGVLLDAREGQSGALAAGFARTRGTVVITLDADGQNDPTDIPALVAALADADVATGVRERREDDWVRRVSSRIANGVRRAVLGDHIQDIGCSLKAYRREALDGLPYFRGVHRFLPALCEMRGARIATVMVGHRPRRHGTSKYGVSNRLWASLRDLFGVWWLRSRLHSARAREVKSDD